MPLKLPLRLRAAAEVIVVEDAAGTRVAYASFEGERGRRGRTHRVTRADAIALARTIAQIVTEQIQFEENPTH